MRTRFLNIDYFNPSNSTLENFLHLPLPHLPPDSPLLDDFLSRWWLQSVTFVPDIDLPIDGAISRFLPNILPQNINLQIGEFSDDLLENRNDCVETQLLEIDDQERMHLLSEEVPEAKLNLEIQILDMDSLRSSEIFSDHSKIGDTLNKPDMGESKKSLNMLPGDLSTLDAQFVGVGSSKKLENRFPKPGNGELLVDSNAERVPLLFESTSMSSDLDFFLNPRKATAGGNSESVAKTLNKKDTFPMVQSGESSAEKEGQSHLFFALDENKNDPKFKELSNSIPMKHKINLKASEAADSLEACSMPVKVPCAPLNKNINQTQSSMSSSFPDKVIIVNTRNFEEEMIISRRSTYQKILAMKKKGAQVVERDSDLPVDVIINAAVCLIWYESKNIGKKSTPRDEASSSLPLCVECISADVLAMLRYAFSCCVLVFEGDMSFIAEIMESSDKLYAAAANLGIDLQLFYSYSAELTDEIILNSIEFATETSRGLYPAMPESETLAELFLTQFPSINPLSAHAVLSSGGMLVEFLEWSHELRIRTTRKYHVPEESVTLFSALCTYGVSDESGMTECSDFLSPASDSEYCPYKAANSERKKQKIISNPSRVSKQYDAGMSMGLSDSKKPDISLNENLFGQKQGPDRATWREISKSDVLHDIGEVINLDLSSMFDADFSSILNSGLQSTFVNAERIDPGARNFKTARRLSFGNTTLPTFPAAAEISGSDLWTSLMHRQEVSGEGSKHNSTKSLKELLCHENEMLPRCSDGWNSMKDNKHSLTQDVTGYSDKDLHIDHMTLTHRSELSGEGIKKNSAKSYEELSFYENDAPHCGETPLRNAICSSQLQQGSPWTDAFLNRIREKSRLRQQSLPCNPSSPGFGGSAPKKIEEKRKRKPSSSKKPLCPTWTPLDKRARQTTLYFATNGTGSEAKLVWR